MLPSDRERERADAIDRRHPAELRLDDEVVAPHDDEAVAMVNVQILAARRSVMRFVTCSGSPRGAGT